VVGVPPSVLVGDTVLVTSVGTVPTAPPPAVPPLTASRSSAPTLAAGLDREQARFVTADAVHLDLRVARLGSRMLARLFDLIIQFAVITVLWIVVVLLWVIMASAGLTGLDAPILTAMQVITAVAGYIAYPVTTETVFRGRTVGKLLVGLRVVRDDGGPITFRQALVRGLVGAAIEWPALLLGPIGWLITLWTMLASPQGKRVGDYAAGTLVIHDRTPASWGWVPVMPAGLAGWAATLDLAGLDDELALAVRHYLARNRQIKEPARTRLGLALAREVAAVTNPPPPSDAAGWAYLAAVYAERHTRALRQLANVRARAAMVWPDLSAAIAAPPVPGAIIMPPPGYPPPGSRPAAPVRPAAPPY
jgi:uncharacterized RDD family membrane protein YckC